MTEINQKEYLKKYLGIGKDDGKKKKRKKKPKAILGAGLKIVDDDLDISHANTVEEAVSLLATNEDAPQICGIVDERPPELRILDYRNNDRWKAIGEDEDNGENSGDKSNAPRGNNSQSDNSPSRRNRSVSPAQKVRKRRNSDNSPPRRRKHQEPHNSEEHRSKNRNRSENSDNSPARKRNAASPLPTIKIEYDSDNSPPRRRNSPPQSRKPVKKEYDSDNSPPRKRNKSPNDSDNSPPRRRNNPDSSPPRRRHKSPVRKRHDSPSRSGSGRRRSERSPEERRNNRSKKSSRWGDKEPESSADRPYLRISESPEDDRRKDKKMTKTLDGKAAGLQNAKDLDAETALLKKREDEHFRTLSADVSGANAATIVRDRKTGKIRDLKKEAEDKREKDKREQVHKEKYARWGKGLKQVEDREEKLAQEAYEMTKPLARYVDDVDLERHLKEQEREGDPMLAYIRSKKKKQDVVTGKPSKLQYDGEFMPNRYGIAPGHRWDGVDRSSGYERRWFETINAKKAQLEDNYKWSTEDM